MAIKLTPEMARAELLRRDRAATSLIDYVQYVDVPGDPVKDDQDGDDWAYQPVGHGIADHHRLMLDVLEQVITGKLPRAMMFLPPGSAKSTYCSVVAPTWAMGRAPATKIILASYGSDLAKKHGRKARSIVRSPHYKAVFEAEISTETAAADEWAISNESEYMAAGILSGITGNRAMGIIIDDPIRGRQDADSETVRSRTWEAYQDDLKTRLIPGGWEVIIQTRWHSDDLAGRLLPEDYDGQTGLITCRDGRPWYVLSIPAQCERADDPLGRKIGDYLWPEWFTPEHFESFKAQARTWAALFQQRPSPETGTFYQRDWFRLYHRHELPRNLHYYISSDFAVTDGKEDADYTEHGVWGVDEQGALWMIDWWHGQSTADVWIEALLSLILTYQPLCWFGEGGVIRRAVEPFLVRRMGELRAFCRTEWVNPVSDKPSRARAFQAMASMGRVNLPDTPDGHRVLDQLISFPTGKHDDAVDACSLIGMVIDQAHGAVVQRIPKPATMAEKDWAALRGVAVNNDLAGAQHLLEDL